MAEREYEPVFSDYELSRYLRDNSPSLPAGVEQAILRFLYIIRDQIESRIRENSLELLWKEAVPWQNKTFPHATPQSIANHILSEAKELADNPYDAWEIADILLLVGHLVSKLKIDTTYWAREKFNLNKQRQWGEVNSEGFVEHVEEKPSMNFIQLGKDGKTAVGVGRTGSMEVEYVKKEEGEAESKIPDRPTVEVDAFRYERVYEVGRGGKLTGRTGKVLVYEVGGRSFAKPPVWDEPQAD